VCLRQSPLIVFVWFPSALEDMNWDYALKLVFAALSNLASYIIILSSVMLIFR
jgi:hypothetical protein